MPRIRFGTDGWRAVIGEDFTFENVRICAQGAADYVNSTGLAPRGFVIGYDTRFASGKFAEAVAEVMAATASRRFCAAAPRRLRWLAHSLVSMTAGAGAVITASHNPAVWNGFKFKPDYGAARRVRSLPSWSATSRESKHRERSGAWTSARPSVGAFWSDSTPLPTT